MSWDAYITDHLMVRSNTSCCLTGLLLWAASASGLVPP